MSNTPLPEPDVSWQDGQDQYGYVTYDHAYSAEAMHAHAAAVSAAKDARIKVLEDALRFYANPGDYKAPYTGGMGKLYFDCGTTARAALGDKTCSG